MNNGSVNLCIELTVIYIVPVNDVVSVHSLYIGETTNLLGQIRVSGIIYYHGTAETIAILRSYVIQCQIISQDNIKNWLTVMRVIPVCSRLIESRELVVKRVAWDDGALVNADRTICPCRSFLKKSVPMLKRKASGWKFLEHRSRKYLQCWC